MRNSISSLRARSRVAARLIRLGACALAVAASFGVQAQTFPNKAVRIIVPYAPGSSVDGIPRMIAERMGADLGQPVVVENKPGGLFMPAINDILNQPADGYTLLASDAGIWAIVPAMQTVTYDFVRDFTPVSLSFTNGLILFTGLNTGINTFQDLVAQAKAKPGQLNYASPGIGSPLHLAIESLDASLGISMKHIPYKGAPEMIESLVRGDTQTGLLAPGAVLALAKAGKVKMLAVSIPNRLKLAPDLPTIAELTSVKDFNFPGQQAFVAKTGTPKAVIDRLSASIRAVGASPEMQTKVLTNTGSELTTSTPEQLQEIIRSDIRKYGAAVKLAGIVKQ